MNILFLHPNMPGQYKHLARVLGASGKHRIFFITRHLKAEIPGVTRISYRLPRDVSPMVHRYLVTSERAVLQGQEAWRVANKLKKDEKFVPDIIVAHPGWGDALFMKDLFPQARILSFIEFYYRAHGSDVGFNPKETFGRDDEARVRIKNVTNLMSLEQMDWGVTPTVWQWSLNPPDFRHKLSVLHDGVDTDICSPNPNATFAVPNGPTFKPGDPVVTYIARNFEPYRGFQTFMQAAEILLRERSNVHIVAVGGDEVSYGRKPAGGLTYRQMYMKEVKLPAERMHWLPKVPYSTLIDLFRVSAAHIYLTYPFVLSWSMLESMASGVALVASNTQPVLEVIEDGKNGLLADFFGPNDVARKVMKLLDAPDHNQAMRDAARQTVVSRYALKDVLPMHVRLVEEVGAGMVPPPVAQDILRFNPIEPHQKAMWHE